MDLERYFFNPDTKECELFLYGGCEGNENNFYSKMECYSKCGIVFLNLIFLLIENPCYSDSSLRRRQIALNTSYIELIWLAPAKS